MALISNIHFGLAAWAAGAFALGQRCSAAGNAYKCVTAGSSTAAPSGTGSSVNNGGTAAFAWLSAVDYASPQAWANALPATLTQPVVAYLWNDAPITTSVGVPVLTLSGHATTASNNITIVPAPGESFVGPGAVDPWSAAWSTAFGPGAYVSPPLAFNAAAGVSVILPASGAGNVNYVQIVDANVVIAGVQFQDPNPTSSSTIFTASQTCTVSGCIFDGYSQGGGAYMINPQISGPASSVFRMVNSLVVDRASAAVASSTVSGNYNSVYANNTFVALNAPAGLGCVTDTSTGSGTVINQTNNVMMGYAAGTVTGSQDASTVINVSYGLFSANAITNASVVLGAGNVYSQSAASQFVSQTADFRLLPTSPAAKGGTTDTADVPAAVDIFGQARPAGGWSIGAYQAVGVTSVGVAGGQAIVSGVDVGGRAVGAAAGKASVAGVSGSGTFASVGTANGHAAVQGVTVGISVGTANGQATVQGYGVSASIASTVTLNNPGVQVVGTPFVATGTLTLLPRLVFSDDASTITTPISSGGVSPIGSGEFSFVHPGVATLGEQNLLVEDLSTEATSAVNYPVVATAAAAAGVTAGIGATLTALAAQIPAYVYEEYADDDNVQAMFQAYNDYAQAYLDWFNAIDLPVYTGLSGPLLDWVAQGLYGIARPVLAVTQIGPSVGPFDTYTLDSLAFDSNTGSSTSTVFTVTDDIYKRIITWSFYKGDGRAFTTTWLKRRVMRFLAGVDGTDYAGPATQVSVTFAGNGVVNISISAGGVPLTVAPVFQAAVLSGVLPLPFQMTFEVLL